MLQKITVRTMLAVAIVLSVSELGLAYVFNPRVASSQLLSSLGAAHQPFNWVFNGLDILAGALIAMSGMWMFRGRRGRHRILSGIEAIAVIGFGLSMIGAAVTPEPCLTGPTCPTWQRDPAAFLHATVSAFNVMFLLLGASVGWWIMRTFFAGFILAGNIIMAVVASYEGTSTTFVGNWGQRVWVIFGAMWLAFILVSRCPTQENQSRRHPRSW